MKKKSFGKRHKLQETAGIFVAAAILTLVPATLFAYSTDELSNTSSKHSGYTITDGRSYTYPKKIDEEELAKRQQDYMDHLMETSEKHSNKEVTKSNSSANSPITEVRTDYEVEVSQDIEKTSDENVQYALLSIDNPDYGYYGQTYNLDYYSRMYIEAIVMREAGYQGYEGCALVAQCMRDALIYKGYNDVYSMVEDMGYLGDTSLMPNEDVKNAVSFIFDNGGMAVQHRIYFYYAWTWTDSDWHETQNHIITYKDHKFFDEWN